MKRSAHSALVTAVTMLTVSATALAPVQPTPPPATQPTIRLTAYVAPTQQSLLPPHSTIEGNSAAALVAPSAASVTLPGLLIDWLERIIVPPSLGKPFPSPEFEPTVVGNSIDSVIKNVYNAVEPWVQWGFEVAAYAVGWVPYVGWLAPQINIFYTFGERIVRSITFNIADWLGGKISFWDGLVNVVVDSIYATIYLGVDQWNFWLPPLPPLPPFPPIGQSAVAAEEEVFTAFSFDEFSPLGEYRVKGDLGEQIVAEGEEFPQGEEELGGGEEQLGGGDDQLPDGEELLEGQAGELDDQGSGDLAATEKDKIEELGDVGETDPDLTVDNSTTTNSSGTVQAQGEIRTSPVATPDGATIGTQTTNSSLGGDPNEQAESGLAPSSPQTPTTNDDGEGNTADLGGDTDAQ